MNAPSDTPYLSWARANAGTTRLCLRGSGMPSRALPVPLPPLRRPPAGQDDLWHERRVGEAVAQRYGVQPEEVFVALGTSGANTAVLTSLLASRAGEPGELLCERPAYDPLWRTAKALGCSVRFFERRADEAWRIDPLALEAGRSHQTQAIIVARPHNPTGVDIPAPVLHSLGEMAEAHDLWVVVDEVYLDFVPDALPAYRIHPRLISTSSLTKVYGSSELRLGWVLAQAERVASMSRRRAHAEALLPTLPHAVALALWDQLDTWRDDARASALEGAAIFEAAVRGIPGVSMAPHAGTPFGFIRVPGDPTELCRALADRDLGVTPGTLFDAPGGLRLGWTRPPEQLREAAAILRTALLERS